MDFGNQETSGIGLVRMREHSVADRLDPIGSLQSAGLSSSGAVSD